ncbi:glycoside hydrolase family 88 protein [Tropicimonas sediminicola]|uniref:Unsaturated chondroitin disaccharide hydrolase n=1 Tax=Tropicimonas sediminicola TaxID=1031541 RepID=A0A239CAV9_9RHOB|nr:glycoside hydrolase family 88 protein [Tropicimonas sediminicola]SNS16828.1 unsaturated chondroitin disaccharide hydrolase [Tropicimonas sediminicola]
MDSKSSSYFASDEIAAGNAAYADALGRVVDRTRELLLVAGLRNPRIGEAGGGTRWVWCEGYDWVMGFFSGQLWLSFQLSGDPVFSGAARARRAQFQWVLDNRRAQDHDLGFLFSLHSVADWRMTGDPAAREMALAAARILMSRFREEGGYIQAWSPSGPDDRARSKFANGRMIADTMQNLALLHWAHRETGRQDFREVADGHAATTARYLLREDGTSFHTYVFDPATGEPLRGETHQGYADESCWSRGQAWLLHGFAQCHAATGAAEWLDAARKVAHRTEALMGESAVPVWDFALPADGTHPVDSSAGAVMAAGLLLLASLTEGDEAARWRAFGERCLDGLLASCDLTGDPTAQGLLAHGAAFVHSGRSDTMLPYGDYYFMEALMRAQGHADFFW